MSKEDGKMSEENESQRAQQQNHAQGAFLSLVATRQVAVAVWGSDGHHQ